MSKTDRYSPAATGRRNILHMVIQILSFLSGNRFINGPQHSRTMSIVPSLTDPQKEKSNAGARKCQMTNASQTLLKPFCIIIDLSCTNCATMYTSKREPAAMFRVLPHSR